MTHTIAVDVRMLRNSGIGVYLRNILPHLLTARPEWRFRIFGRPNDVCAFAGYSNVECAPFEDKIYSIAEQVDFPRHLGPEVSAVWVPHFNIPVFSRRPKFVTVHDIAHLRAPSAAGGIHRKLYAKTLLNHVRSRAAAVFFVSEFTKAEFCRYVGEPRGRTYITPNAAAPIWKQAAPIVSSRPRAGRYILFIGNVKPHKNLQRLMLAYEQLAKNTDVDLVIIGKKDGFLLGDPEVFRLAERMPERVHFTGMVSDEEVVRWMKHADVFVFPSLYEGFGIPPLEAMSVSCPSVVADIPPLRETCGDAAEYVNPYDVSDIARGINRVLSDRDYAESLKLRGRSHAEKYDFAASAAIISGAMESALTQVP